MVGQGGIAETLTLQCPSLEIVKGRWFVENFEEFFRLSTILIRSSKSSTKI